MNRLADARTVASAEAIDGGLRVRGTDPLQLLGAAILHDDRLQLADNVGHRPALERAEPALGQPERRHRDHRRDCCACLGRVRGGRLGRLSCCCAAIAGAAAAPLPPTRHYDVIRRNWRERWLCEPNDGAVINAATAAAFAASPSAAGGGGERAAASPVCHCPQLLGATDGPVRPPVLFLFSSAPCTDSYVRARLGEGHTRYVCAALEVDPDTGGSPNCTVERLAPGTALPGWDRLELRLLFTACLLWPNSVRWDGQCDARR